MVRPFVAAMIALAAAGLLACERGEQAVRVAAQDFRFSPATIRLHADASARLTIVNEGREPHEFDSPLLTDARVRLLETPESFRLAPGGSLTIVFQAPPGTYPFRCRVRGHPGMEGTVIVES